ncbi:MAG TPA: carboxymuconolactone decarboxylase family protein [Trueperaceae bacterium]
MRLRPEAIKSFRGLTKAIKRNMDPRRFELATLAAAKALPSGYCMLSHNSFLRRMGAYDEQLTAIARDYHNAGLSSGDVALMAFAEKITRHADKVVAEDVVKLRSHGFTDEEILDTALTAALRNFYNKLLDAVGAEPDAAYAQLDEGLRKELVLTRPSEKTAPTGSW